MKKITIYSTNTCAYCKMLEKWLDQNKFEYTDIKVDEDAAAAQKMVELSGQMGVPFTTIEDQNDKGEYVIANKILGFDLPKFKQALGVTGNAAA